MLQLKLGVPEQITPAVRPNYFMLHTRSNLLTSTRTSQAQIPFYERYKLVATFLLRYASPLEFTQHPSDPSSKLAIRAFLNSMQPLLPHLHTLYAQRYWFKSAQASTSVCTLYLRKGHVRMMHLSYALVLSHKLFEL